MSYEIDPTLVRGLDYYTRTVFELTSEKLGAQSGVGGGGRYDGLVAELGGPPTPGMGWAAGIERILLAGQAPAAGTAAIDLYIAFEKHFYEGPQGGSGAAFAWGPASRRQRLVHVPRSENTRSTGLHRWIAHPRCESPRSPGPQGRHPPTAARPSGATPQEWRSGSCTKRAARASRRRWSSEAAP